MADKGYISTKDRTGAGLDFESNEAVEERIQCRRKAAIEQAASDIGMILRETPGIPAGLVAQFRKVQQDLRGTR